MSRKALIAANWKMYKTPAEAKAFVDAFLPLVAGHTRDEIALFPSPVLLPSVTAAAKGSNVAVGAQNIHFAEEGAFTGETSVGQLKAVNGTHTLIGHSERRQYFAETDEIVNKKLHTALKHGVVPVVCIGEVLAEREAGKTASVLKTQITGAFAGITAEMAAPIVIAYEPVWPSARVRRPLRRWRWTRTRSSVQKWPSCWVRRLRPRCASCMAAA
jgi:triosephosphate isomerase